MAVDAFSLSWTNLKGYAFPPFNMITKCYIKFVERKGQFNPVGTGVASAIIVAIMKLVWQLPRIIRTEIALLSNPLGNPQPFLVRGYLLLAAWMLSGSGSNPEVFG